MKRFMDVDVDQNVDGNDLEGCSMMSIWKLPRTSTPTWYFRRVLTIVAMAIPYGKGFSLGDAPRIVNQQS